MAVPCGILVAGAWTKLGPGRRKEHCRRPLPNPKSVKRALVTLPATSQARLHRVEVQDGPSINVDAKRCNLPWRFRRSSSKAWIHYVEGAVIDRCKAVSTIVSDILIPIQILRPAYPHFSYVFHQISPTLALFLTTQRSSSKFTSSPHQSVTPTSYVLLLGYPPCAHPIILGTPAKRCIGMSCDVALAMCADRLYGSRWSCMPDVDCGKALSWEPMYLPLGHMEGSHLWGRSGSTCSPSDDCPFPTRI